MHISVKRLMDCAIEATRGVAKPVTTFTELADRLGESPQTINNWKKRGVSQSGALKAETAFGCSPRYVLDGTGAAFAHHDYAQTPVAQPMSLDGAETVPSLKWEQLMSEDQKGALPQIFRVGVPDSSMAPRVNPGAMVVLNTREAPRPGDGVLVRDKTGQVHLREFRAGRPGIWEAHAVNPAYAALESERDGLTVLAVLMAVEARWG